ncbi:nucleoside hydrolase [Deinococcus radiodurans]|jgi:Inosine-uridine nucleoside N-ribohydrolase|uniref:Inosine-uridine preferring nucleoside hydrolase n=1 Tax=Deinococcus radiodurans (strain ATCC 13939 / DSM 20539 / JCM 16871 / CCUG 27074 / LMG 4051 / NBRC 15346 / NCIMB 9279 / VKM B-1422 / R1) TaxID=243230 RepID=Q9RXB2_DEIRA|nr:nucleoside hydrolase [Deinococcus radiodurans]AAF09982.1 inosine-uridine preferring nucleoside hydrolase [Deinococcus radiodurans R1 = ATCC 13939 = DSM 20539]ANC72348.1 ribonucleoside hydrolase [Deinococcus radiodurans R1 = ATCC 13939 = DSM 20539]QEM72355.1 nucleoside hydrolase [Deinococcus radiodurans]QIP28589.1 nucleoside hydrolase [Deinococcus radiodurans]QIP32702.1 nucleoside hydrolase [Deinococcus radiodurans]
MVSSLPVLLDGDPGLDDAVAWLLAFASPETQVLGVTAVHGNVPLQQGVRNTGVVLALAGERAAGVPYFAGADRPLLREGMTATQVHGATGLPAAHLPEPVRGPEAEHAVDFIIRTVRANPGQITLVASGPLTNVALAFRLAPDLPGLLREVVWMGGSTAQGNRTPAAEFNALADPHAAHIVLHSPVPVRMVGLNVTMQCIATPERLEQLRALGNRAGAVSAEMLEFYAGVYRERYGLSGGALHDPLAVAAALSPELLTWQAMNVEVELSEGLNVGRTVCDLYGVTDREKNVQVAVGVDDAAFFKLLLERLGTLP